MGAALAIRDDLSAAALRRQARREPNRRAALRLLAIANALDGLSRAEAARLAGPRAALAARCCADGASALPMLERQAWRDAVVRSNAAGLAGLYDRPKPGRSPRLSAAEQAVLAGHVFRGPDPERDGVSAWTRADLCCWLAARYGKAFHPSSLSRVLRRLAAEDPAGAPAGRPAGTSVVPEKGLRRALSAVAAAHPSKRVVLWLMDG